jgi:Tfp pilus assembly protein PilV
MKNNKGFTLVETLITMVLLMVAVFVFTPIFAMSLKQISDAGEWQNKKYGRGHKLKSKLPNAMLFYPTIHIR